MKERVLELKWPKLAARNMCKKDPIVATTSHHDLFLHLDLSKFYKRDNKFFLGFYEVLFMLKLED